eukprot:12891315-Prorocentrum_lima.AAC.1
MPNAILCLGGVHVSHNAPQDAGRVLQGWSDFLPGLKAVANLLHKDHLCQRCVGTCAVGMFEPLAFHCRHQ